MPYKTIGKIASGTFGTVYKVKSIETNEIFALKLIHENYKTPKELKRIKRGFESAQKVSHPNCVKMIEWYEKEKEIGFVMEFVDTSTPLSNQTISYQQKISKIIQIANGLDALHSQGIVHRDLKPSNILETKDGQIKITDFDLVKLDSSSTLTDSGAFLGTAKYSSPEQCQDSSKIDHRSDLYSLGILFYKLITGIYPIKGSTIGEISLAHLRSPIISPKQIIPELPIEIEKVILRLLEKNPKDRFQSASEVAIILNSLVDENLIQGSSNPQAYLLPSIFVSRKEELKRLERKFSEASNGNSKSIFISGESGVGKTRLWKEFKLGLKLENTCLLETRCFKNGLALESLSKIISELVEMLSSFSDKEKIEKIGRFAWDLAKIYSPLSQMPFMSKIEKVEDLGGEKNEFRFFEALTNFIKNLTKGKSLVIFFEDLQWADEVSVKWINYLIRNLKDKSLLLIGTFRSMEIEKSVFGKNLEHFKNDFSPEIIDMQNLTLQDVKQMLTSLLGKADPVETEFAKFILEKTKGSPLFVQEMIYNFFEQNLLTDSNGKWDLNLEKFSKVKISNSIYSVISERLSFLKKETFETLQLCSVLGESFGEETIYQISKTPKEELQNNLDTILSLKFLEKTASQKYSFTHGSVRETLEKAIDAKTKKKLHKQAGEFLEQRFSSNKTEVIEELANHFYKSEIQEKAIKYCLEAGEVLFERYSYQNSLRYIENAIELLEKTKNLKQTIDLYLRKGQILMQLGHIKEARNICLKALKLSERIKDFSLTTKSNKIISDIYFSIGDFTNTSLYLEKAIEGNEKLGNKETLGENLLFYSANLLRAGQMKKSEEVLNQSISIFKELKNQEKLAHAYRSLASMMQGKGDNQEAIKFLLNQLKISEELNDIKGVIHSMEILGEAYQCIGNFELALKYNLQVKEKSGKIWYYKGIAKSLGRIANIYNILGKLDKALECLKETVSISKKIGDNFVLSASYGNIGITYAYLGDYEKALEFINKHLKQSKTNKHKNGIAEALVLNSILNAELGNFEEALEKSIKAREIFEEIESQDKIATSFFYEAKIYKSQKFYKKAEKHFNKAILIAKDKGFEIRLTEFLVEKAEMFYFLEQFKKAKTLIEEASEFIDNNVSLEVAFKVKVLTALLSFEEGNHDSSINFFISELENRKQEVEKAELHFHLTRLGVKSYDLGIKILTKEQIDFHKEKSTKLYGILFTKTPKYLYKERIKKLKSVSFRPQVISPNLLRSLVKWMNPETVFSELLSFLSEECKASGCQLILKNKLEDKFETYAVSPKLKEADLDFSSGILVKAIENKNAILIKDATDSLEFKSNKSVIGKGFLSVIAVPLEINETIFGALYLQRTKIKFGFFQDEDLNKVIEIAKILTPILLRHQELNKLKIESEIRNFGFVGNSPKMQNLYKEIESASKVNYPVYIHGETGTGKELVANSLHKIGTRKSKPFVVLNCATIPKDLAESELFGHEKGAFSGASKMSEGKFELANEGTLFLDEIGELALPLQAKLLRAIQEKEIWRVGGKKSIKIDSRIIIATHKDLKEEVEKGNFREDLYHRLNVLKIEIPPLRERLEDIPLLANYFLEKINKEVGKEIAGFTAETLILLQQQQWAGNVRELENKIAKGLVMKKTDSPLTPQDLGLAQNNLHFNSDKEQSQATQKRIFEGRNLEEKLGILVKEILFSELEANNWNKTKTADSLEIQRDKLYRLMKKHNL